MSEMKRVQDQASAPPGVWLNLSKAEQYCDHDEISNTNEDDIQAQKEMLHDMITTRLESYTNLSVIATFFAGFAIADLSANDLGDTLVALSPLAKKTYILCQSLTVTLNLFAALTMIFVDISTKRILVQEKHQNPKSWARDPKNAMNREPKNLNSVVGAAYIHLQRMEKPLGACQPHCAFLFVSNLAWHAVLLSVVSCMIALGAKLTANLTDDNDETLFEYAAIALAAGPIGALIIIIRMNCGSRFFCTQVDS